MHPNKLVVAILFFIGITGFPIESRSAGVIAVACFNGPPPPGKTGPNPTAICALTWTQDPAGKGVIADYTTIATGVNPVTPPDRVRTVHNIVNPPDGLVLRHISIICLVTASTIVADLSGNAIARKPMGLMWFPVQSSFAITGGTYPEFCPGASQGTNEILE
jgi:hypothetical protein